MNTKSCSQMLFYHSGPYSPGAKICPRYTINANDVDSCTAQPYSWEGITCNTYCKSFPGLKCLDGAAALGDSCLINQLYGRIGCDAIGDYHKLW